MGNGASVPTNDHDDNIVPTNNQSAPIDGNNVDQAINNITGITGNVTAIQQQQNGYNGTIVPSTKGQQKQKQKPQNGYNGFI